MAREVAAMSADLQNLPQAAVRNSRAGPAIRKPQHQDRELSARPAKCGSSAPWRVRVEALERKLDETWQARTTAPEVPAEVLAPAGRARRPDRSYRQLPNAPDFEREFKQLQSNLEAAMASSSARPPVGFEALMERMDQIDENLRAVDLRSEVRPLEDMLYQLAARLDAAEQPNAGL